jgi:hypothetical protein
MTNDLLIFGENICAFSHIFIFYQCRAESVKLARPSLLPAADHFRLFISLARLQGQRWAPKNRRRMPRFLKKSVGRFDLKIRPPSAKKLQKGKFMQKYFLYIKIPRVFICLHKKVYNERYKL